MESHQNSIGNDLPAGIQSPNTPLHEVGGQSVSFHMVTAIEPGHDPGAMALDPTTDVMLTTAMPPTGRRCSLAAEDLIVQVKAGMVLAVAAMATIGSSATSRLIAAGLVRNDADAAGVFDTQIVPLMPTAALLVIASMFSRGSSS